MVTGGTFSVRVCGTNHRNDGQDGQYQLWMEVVDAVGNETNDLTS